jgi:hypothetical protein
MTDTVTEARVFRPTKGRPRSFRFLRTQTKTTVVEVEVWEGVCATCGGPFQVEVPAGAYSTCSNSFDLVNCPEHRNCTPGHGGGRPKKGSYPTDKTTDKIPTKVQK